MQCGGTEWGADDWIEGLDWSMVDQQAAKRLKRMIENDEGAANSLHCAAAKQQVIF